MVEQYKSLSGLGKISYSFKTNPLVGSVLEECTDSLFSVHFINEIHLINDKKRIIFLAQSLNATLLGRLFSFDIKRFVVENEKDLELLVTYIEKNKKQIDLFLRMKLKENTIKTEKHYVFGLSASDINKNISQLKGHPYVKKLGIHVHRKTQNISEWDLVRELSELLTSKTLDLIDYMNIGGGLPVMYKNISDKAIPSILGKLKELHSWLASKNITMIVEPGRFISGPAVSLETEIVGIHDNTLVVDASVYNSSPDTLIVPIKLLVQGETESGKGYIIKGITPCSTDIFRYRVYFPETHLINVGQKLIFLNAGAYNFHTNFCEQDKIETYFID